MEITAPKRYALPYPPLTGAWIGLAVIVLWFVVLGIGLTSALDWRSPWPYLGLLLMTHLYTGLFITAHDAMHGTVAPFHPRLNHTIGWMAATLHAYNPYFKLRSKHHLHHAHVATANDPDFHDEDDERFWPWYIRFLRQYLTPLQIILMALTFNGLYRLFFPVENVIWYWMIPAILSTLQLFYFGTYLPHRGEPGNQHHSRSTPPPHWRAFLECYFFGYHYEHHDRPGTPWWRLPLLRDAAMQR